VQSSGVPLTHWSENNTNAQRSRSGLCVAKLQRPSTKSLKSESRIQAGLRQRPKYVVRFRLICGSSLVLKQLHFVGVAVGAGVRVCKWSLGAFSMGAERHKIVDYSHLSNASNSRPAEGVFDQAPIRGTEDVLRSLRIARHSLMHVPNSGCDGWFVDWQARRKTEDGVRSAQVIPTPVVCSCRSPNDDKVTSTDRACCSARDAALWRRCSFPARRFPLSLAAVCGRILRRSLRQLLLW
jgi:hypothetical protein